MPRISGADASPPALAPLADPPAHPTASGTSTGGAGPAPSAADRIETPAPAPPDPAAAARGMVVHRLLDGDGTATGMASALETLAHGPKGEAALLRATADGPAFAHALAAEATRRGVSEAVAARAFYVTENVVAGVLGERVRAAAAAQITAKVKQIDRVLRAMRGETHDPAALEAFFHRFGAVPATARAEVLAAHHLDVANDLVSDPSLFLFSRSRSGAADRAELLATGQTKVLGVPVSLAEMAEGLETLRGELETAKAFVWDTKAPLLVFRPVTRRLGAIDPRYARAFALRRWVEGGVAIADPERYGFGVDFWHRLSGRNATLARALWAAGVVDHGQVDHAENAYHAGLAGQVVSVVGGIAATPEVATEALGVELETQAEKAVAGAAEKILTRQGATLVTRLGRRAAEARLTAEVRGAAERALGPAVDRLVSSAAGAAVGRGGAQALVDLARPVRALVANWVSQAAARAVGQGLGVLLGSPDPRVERVAGEVRRAAARATGTVLGMPGASVGNLAASLFAREDRTLDDPATSVIPGYRWDGSVGRPAPGPAR